jgi:exonuclease VII large subunit
MQAQGIAEVQSKLIGALPMLQESLTEQLQNTLSDLETKTVENATHTLQDKISRLHEDLLTQHQVDLARESKAIYQGLTEQSQSELTIYLDALQLKSKQQLYQEVGDAFPLLFQGLSGDVAKTLKQDLTIMAESAKNNFIQHLNAELPEVEQILANKVQELLKTEVPRIEQQLSLNIKAEIEKLLDSVRLIFSK